MRIVKQYWLVFSIFLLVSLLVLIRTFSQKNFRYDAVKWAEPSAIGSNILTEDQVSELNGKKLLVSLGNEASVSKQFQDITLRMSPESILDKENFNRIRRNKGPVILSSDYSSVSAKTWMVLSEMGLKNIYVLSNRSDYEIRETKFRTDSAIRPELQDKNAP
jgi:hypothetical protein